MSQFTSLPEGTDEGRKVDLFMESAMDFQATFFANAKIVDIIGCIESCEDKWPADRLLELSHRLHDMATMPAGVRQ
jgi:hypothetical protein